MCGAKVSFPTAFEASKMAPSAAPFAFLLCALCLSTSLAAAQFAPNTTYQKLQQSFPPSAYVYSPPWPFTIGNLTQLTDVGGVSTRRTMNEWPTLTGTGLSQTLFTLAPCGLRQPHTHPRASGLLYTIAASNLQVGFVQLDGTLVVNNISTGASTVFPQGLLHYQQNLDCNPAVYIITYNDAEGETVNAVPALMAIPPAAVELVLGVSLGLYQQLQLAAINSPFVAGSNPDCMRRCGLSLTKPRKIVG